MKEEKMKKRKNILFLFNVFGRKNSLSAGKCVKELIIEIFLQCKIYRLFLPGTPPSTLTV